MRQLDSEIWVAEAPLRFLGLELGARMTVMRLGGSRLVLHSPVTATDELVGQVRALGSVAYIVAPNRFHHRFVGQWQQAFPEASLFVAPGLERKRPDLPITGRLTDEPDSGWVGTIDQALLGGIPSTNEVVFFHRPSRTLVASDLAFNVGPRSPGLTRAVFRMGGTYGRLSPTLLERLLVRDRAAFRRSLLRVLEWPFERVVVAHGEVSEKNGRAELSRAYSWVLDGGRA
jgi:hypothetical protein